ncbi:MAG: hypothetical protein EAZ89_11705 [Bacteroidetes bacterium]|nr:MAG: hypothetical protein EAZ89_11705 [Bacteroidota bacterium]
MKAFFTLFDPLTRPQDTSDGVHLPEVTCKIRYKYLFISILQKIILFVTLLLKAFHSIRGTM